MANYSMINSRWFLLLACVACLAGCAGRGALPVHERLPADVQVGAAHEQGAAPLESVTLTPTRVPLVPGGNLEPLVHEETLVRDVALLEPPTDLWDRIRRGFAMQDLDGALVRDRERWYADRPDYILRMTERSRKYLFHIVEELELRRMPAELALLPFVESAFNPQAVSSARAAGMWQFMPATGRDFELKQNAFRDDRRDVIASTDAALDYLQKLHAMFGDWHLALAAYNWGEGNVARAIEKNRRAKLAAGYLDLKMPAETRLYVPKLQAIKNIVAEPDNFVATFPLIGNHPYFQTVAITHDIDMALAARLADIALEDFRALNPSMSRPVILAAGTQRILLPWDNAAVFERNLRSHAGKQLASWTAWRAPLTMRPADAAKRVGMREQELRAINQIPAGRVIMAGSTLLVPRGAAVREDVAERVADDAQLTLGPETRLVRRIVRAQKNETVAGLARRYGLAVRNVARWNGVHHASKLKPGQRITIYLPASPRTRAPKRRHPERGASRAKPATR